MTERLYYNDCYLREFRGRVIDTADDGRKIYLDRTAFYPTSGGQPFDTGTLAGIKVLEVVDEEDRIGHVLESPLGTSSPTRQGGDLSNPTRESGDHPASKTPLVIEIGPGKGALTESLLERAERVVAIELDAFFVHYLNQKFLEPIAQGRLTLIEGDVLKTDLSAWGPAVIAGNLPYYITSPILEKVFELGDSWTSAVFLMQAEVAERVAAEPGSRNFGYLSVQTQVMSRPEILFPVSRTAFRPPPKVDSAVVRLVRRDANAEFGLTDVPAFLRFASACFRQKRKTLRNNLAPMYGKEIVDAMPEGRLRAEQLGVAQLIALYRRFE
jgi:16S rRNA (adenine1518-N6/adenine1519-N6)-dimethyltransferase